ncbi:hypothetical protein LOK49_LG04G03018 [Camellia lanceoleosa]|uniref:Uncharacterized protein n=1 Tax=Camellia lanceoleosa TaxID=1840588 RepID=A0ACC0HZN4_9ERIC|nr:hypothetical protein LOK49_LG04G03018 [Camellia lanceoleosa]
MQSCTSFVTGSFVFHVIPGCPVKSKPVSMCVTTLDLHLTQIFLFYNEGDLVDAVVPFMEAGDHVAIDEPIAQIEIDKFSYVTSLEAGIIQKFVAAEGDTFELGTKIAVISKSGEGVTHVAPSANAERLLKRRQTSKSIPQKLLFLRRHPRRSLGHLYHLHLDLGHRTSTSSKGKGKKSSNDKTQERLKDSQNTFALLTTFNEVDMTNLMKLRSNYKDVFVEKHGVKLGLMSGFVKVMCLSFAAAVSGLQNQPIINPVIDEDDDIIYRDYIDISIAIGTSKVSHLSK